LSGSCEQQLILVTREDKSRDFRRAAKSHRHPTAHPAADIELGAAHIEEAFIKLLEMNRQHHWPEDGNANLPAMRMAGQHPMCPQAAEGEDRIGIMRESDDRRSAIDARESLFGIECARPE